MAIKQEEESSQCIWVLSIFRSITLAGNTKYTVLFKSRSKHLAEGGASVTYGTTPPVLQGTDPEGASNTWPGRGKLQTELLHTFWATVRGTVQYSLHLN